MTQRENGKIEKKKVKKGKRAGKSSERSRDRFEGSKSKKRK